MAVSFVLAFAMREKPLSETIVEVVEGEMEILQYRRTPRTSSAGVAFW
jgi:hypothetical protein